MFKSARLKLTAWYLLIIMFISLSFSFVIYGFVSNEINRFAAAQRFRIERRFVPSIIEENLINEIHNRLLLSLGIVNVSILLISGTLGYFLAGRTLTPIQTMVDDQNRFVSDASHEFRTPLTSLKSAMEVGLRNKKLTITQARKLISDNITDVNHLQTLSDGLLQLAQFQKPNNSIKFDSIFLEDIVTKAIQKVGPIAQNKSVSFVNRTKNIQFQGNLNSLIDLLVILLDNAVKYSPAKTKVSLLSKKFKNNLQFSVSDTGIGISPLDLPHIFNRFYRADIARSNSDINGYGLGLSIAQKIVESHHGSISVDSKVGQGSTFIIHLPLQQFS